MSREAQKVFFASALGAGVGTFVSLQLGFFWILGLFAGGLVGYLSYEWHMVILAVKYAYRAPSRIPFYRYNWVVAGWGFLFLQMLSFWVTGSLTGVFWVLDRTDFDVLKFALPLYLILFSFSLWIAIISSFDSDSEEYLERIEHAKRYCWYLFPPVAIWLLVQISFQIIKLVPEAAKDVVVWIGSYLWRVFLLIHSGRRLICGLDAFLGAWVGYSFGSVLIGTLAGGIFGLVNYLVITEGILKPRGLVQTK